MDSPFCASLADFNAARNDIAAAKECEPNDGAPFTGNPNADFGETKIQKEKLYEKRGVSREFRINDRCRIEDWNPPITGDSCDHSNGKCEEYSNRTYTKCQQRSFVIEGKNFPHKSQIKQLTQHGGLGELLSVSIERQQKRTASQPVLL